MQGAYYSSSDIFVIFTIVITIFTFLVPNVSQLVCFLMLTYLILTPEFFSIIPILQVRQLKHREL